MQWSRRNPMHSNTHTHSRAHTHSERNRHRRRWYKISNGSNLYLCAAFLNFFLFENLFRHHIVTLSLALVALFLFLRRIAGVWFCFFFLSYPRMACHMVPQPTRSRSDIMYVLRLGIRSSPTKEEWIDTHKVLASSGNEIFPEHYTLRIEVPRRTMIIDLSIE